MLSDGKRGLCDLMMVNETKAKVTQTPFTPHLLSLSISACLFCPVNAVIELPAEEARSNPYSSCNNFTN